MRLQRQKNHPRSFRSMVIALALMATIPFIAISAFLIISLSAYSRAYDKIINNITVANSYNLVFKEQVDESTYKLVVGAVTYETIDDDAALENPYRMIDGLRGVAQDLMRVTTDTESRVWLMSLLRNLRTLRDREDDIRDNLAEDGHYDENIRMLDDNIYILTELIQEDMQNYIYYQTQSIARLEVALNHRVYTFIVVSSLMVVLLAVLVTLGITHISRGITEPINGMVKVTQQIATGNLEARIGQAKKGQVRELAQLSSAINDMTRSLKDYVEQIKENERKMRGAELRLLQEQINPHFLYNALDTIVWLIEGKKLEEAKNMVVSLSGFFRLVLNHGREYTTVRDEENHIRSYLQIQQVRYQDILEYEIRMDPEIHQYQILKMTLQPLVENALYHGIKYKRAMGKIIILGYRRDDLLIFEVEDNGIGMDEDELQTLREEISKPCKETAKGFGLANVNERLRMNYGSAYGLQIFSAKGKGTKVMVRIPAKEVTNEEVKA